MGSADRSFTVEPLRDIPRIVPGDDLVDVIRSALDRSRLRLEPGDILVLAQKIVSKAEGRIVDLRSVSPGERAGAIAEATGKDPRLVELILSESTEVVRTAPGVLIVEHRLGMVLANAGIDRSNVEGTDSVLLLPLDPDATCARIRQRLEDAEGVALGLMIIDSIGRAWRRGTIGTAIGVSGVAPVLDLRGEPDMFGRRLETTEVGHADELAAAASIVMGQASEGLPIVLIRGLRASSARAGIRDALRPKAQDLFR